MRFPLHSPSLPARWPRGNPAFARSERGRAGRARRVGKGFVERLVDGQRPARGNLGGERLVLEPSSERRRVGPETEPPADTLHPG